MTVLVSTKNILLYLLYKKIRTILKEKSTSVITSILSN